MAGMALLVAFQEKLVYVPVLPGLTKSYALTPARLRLKYEDVWLRSSDGVRLHAWFIKLFPECKGVIFIYLMIIVSFRGVTVEELGNGFSVLGHFSKAKACYRLIVGEKLELGSGLYSQIEESELWIRYMYVLLG